MPSGYPSPGAHLLCTLQVVGCPHARLCQLLGCDLPDLQHGSPSLLMQLAPAVRSLRSACALHALNCKSAAMRRLLPSDQACSSLPQHPQGARPHSCCAQ